MSRFAQPCPKHLCPHTKPCPDHPDRPRNASWSTGRDRAEQARFRKRILHQAGNQCQRCGASNVPLQAHHTQGENGLALCTECHRAMDPHAR